MLCHYDPHFTTFNQAQWLSTGSGVKCPRDTLCCINCCLRRNCHFAAIEGDGLVHGVKTIIFPLRNRLLALATEMSGLFSVCVLPGVQMPLLYLPFLMRPTAVSHRISLLWRSWSHPARAAPSSTHQLWCSFYLRWTTLTDSVYQTRPVPVPPQLLLPPW